jgi:Flp pilus assembly protein TadG
MKCSNKIRRLRRDASGAAIVEFAFLFPVLLLLMFGTIEVTNYVYAHQKVQSAADNILNILNLQGEVSTTQLASMSKMLPEVAKPLVVGASDYKVIITAMQRDEGQNYAYVRWQYSHGGGSGGSHFPPKGGHLSGDAIQGFTFAENDQVMVVEAYMKYQSLLPPVFMEGFGIKDGFLYFKTSPARPRSGSFQFDPEGLQ